MGDSGSSPDQDRRELTGLLTLTVGDVVRTRCLPRQSTVTLGRGRLNGLEIQAPWVPRELVTFDPTQGGWLAINGPRVRVRLSGLWVDGAARFLPKARMMLSEGWWGLAWEELDAPCSVRVDVHPQRPGERLPSFVLDAAVSRNTTFQGTLFGVYGIRMNDLTKHQLAIVFRHLIEQTPAPTNLYRTRAAELGMQTAEVRNLVSRIRGRINRERQQDLADADRLGVYLVDVSQMISDKDLTA
jgi:hypothetical protein